ncbi:MAG: hypothetical protein EBS41_07900 [Actinobacteria bacterium]|nr:hypothetical protein [Actinomycetota bacterium]
MNHVESDQPRSHPLQPHPSRLSPNDAHFELIMKAHALAVATRHQGYQDPVSGLFVLTAEAHLSRGSCCHNGCRHCPYVADE